MSSEEGVGGLGCHPVFSNLQYSRKWFKES